MKFTTQVTILFIYINITSAYLYRNLRLSTKKFKSLAWIPLNEDEKLGFLEYEKMVKSQMIKDLNYKQITFNKIKEKKFTIIEFENIDLNYFNEQHGEVPICDNY